MERIGKIRSADVAAAAAAREKWNRIAKPLGSFGILEDLVVKTAAVQGTSDVVLSQRTAVIMCADNGVVTEGISQSGQDVTARSAAAIAEGRSNINALADVYGAAVLAVDIGVAQDFPADTRIVRDTAAALRPAGSAAGAGAVLDRKIARGAGNIAREPAMTHAQVQQAIVTGMDIVRDLAAAGTQVIVTGEMGIGNTTIASVLAAVYLKLPAQEVTGRGAGLSTCVLQKKTEVVRRAAALLHPDADDPLDVLTKVGGYDVAGMAGLFLGGAYYGIPVITDGVVSAAAAYTAFLLNPLCAEYILPGHVSAEPAGRIFPERMGLKPVIDARLRLGEGTGGILLLPLLDGALALYRNAHTFEGLGIEAYKQLT